MDFFDLISKRESCRNYEEKPVEKEKILKCIEAVRLAPSACNSQPWSFVVTNSHDISHELSVCLQEAGMNKFTDKAPAFIVVVEEKPKLSARLGGAVKKQDYSSIDIGIAASHICLAATEQGLSTCIMGWFNESKLKSLLNIPKYKRIRLVISLGYSANDVLRKKIRKPLEDILKYID